MSPSLLCQTKEHVKALNNQQEDDMTTLLEKLDKSMERQYIKELQVAKI